MESSSLELIDNQAIEKRSYWWNRTNKLIIYRFEGRLRTVYNRYYIQRPECKLRKMQRKGEVPKKREFSNQRFVTQSIKHSLYLKQKMLRKTRCWRSGIKVYRKNIKKRIWFERHSIYQRKLIKLIKLSSNIYN